MFDRILEVIMWHLFRIRERKFFDMQNEYSNNRNKINELIELNKSLEIDISNERNNIQMYSKRFLDNK